MGNEVKPELSKNNKYYISRDRYYELRHFCMQYPQFKKELADLCYLDSLTGRVAGSNEKNSPVEKIVLLSEKISKNIALIDICAEKCDPVIGKYVHKAVTENKSFTWLKMNTDIPCEKDMYYDRYRRFFWLLHKVRG